MGLQVVSELQDKAVSYSNSLGIGGGNFTCGPFSQAAIFHAKCLKSRYLQCVSLVGDVLFRRVGDPSETRPCQAPCGLSHCSILVIIILGDGR